MIGLTLTLIMLGYLIHKNAVMQTSVVLVPQKISRS
jgi:hypothetical protein